MSLERIYHGTLDVRADELLKWCMENKISIHFHPPYKDKPLTAYANLHTTKREQEFIPKLQALGWKFYHHPPSTGVYKTIGFLNITL